VSVALAQIAFVYAHLAAGRADDAVESARAALDIFGRVEKQTNSCARRSKAISKSAPRPRRAAGQGPPPHEPPEKVVRINWPCEQISSTAAEGGHYRSEPRLGRFLDCS